MAADESKSRLKEIEHLSVVAAYGRLRLLEDTLDATTAAGRFGMSEPVTAEELEDAARHRQLLAVVGVNGELRFPSWQFREEGGVIPGFADILRVLSLSPIGEDMGAVTFFLNPNPLTGGKPPIEALREGEKEAVILAAEDARY